MEPRDHEAAVFHRVRRQDLAPEREVADPDGQRDQPAEREDERSEPAPEEPAPAAASAQASPQGKPRQG
jgi:hypothetical protein